MIGAQYEDIECPQHVVNVIAMSQEQNTTTKATRSRDLPQPEIFNPFTDNDIGSALALRDLMSDLRQDGSMMGGPAPMTPKDRSRFLSKLDDVINAVRRAQGLPQLRRSDPA